MPTKIPPNVCLPLTFNSNTWENVLRIHMLPADNISVYGHSFCMGWFSHQNFEVKKFHLKNPLERFEIMTNLNTNTVCRLLMWYPWKNSQQYRMSVACSSSLSADEHSIKAYMRACWAKLSVIHSFLCVFFILLICCCWSPVAFFWFSHLQVLFFVRWFSQMHLCINQ